MKVSAPLGAVRQPKPMKTAISQTAAFLARHAHLAALAVFAIIGAAVLGDYGIALDEKWQRDIGYASFNYLLGDENALFAEGDLPAEDDHNRLYGVAFEIPLIAAERVFRLEDSRSAHLSRRLLTHALFLAGGFFAWLLAYRLFGNRLVALFAMLIFLLHPRIYAHSFFNTKDLPFLCAFMVALYLIHRAFRRDTVWAFALCGAGIGLLMNIRVMGAMLIPAVLGMLALDALFAARRGEPGWGIKPALAKAAAFSLAFAAALYAAFPLLWRDPSGLADAFRVLATHPVRTPTLFQGEWIRWPNIPWDYIPVWALITTPPIALALSALGIAAVVRLCAARPRGMFADSPARFGALALACLILPAAAAIALNSNMYNDWRQMYFLYAPMSVLAAFGLWTLAALPNPRLRAGAFALAALGIAAVIVQMVGLHPYQHEYFSPVLDKRGVADRFGMNYWLLSYKEALDTLLEMRAGGRIAVTSPDSDIMLRRNLEFIPPDGRGRLAVNRIFPAFRIILRGGGEDAVWKREVYGVPIASVLDVRAETEAAFREIYDEARSSEPAASAAGGFELYMREGTLTYVNPQCADADARGRFYLSVFPKDRADLPSYERAAGREHQALNFDFARYGALIDGKCLIIRDLPGYPIAAVETGQWIPGEGELWSARIEVGE